MNTTPITWRKEGNAMQCHRCNGVMVLEQLSDFYNAAGRLSSLSWRCINCGEIVDPVIIRNREEKIRSLLMA